MKAHKKLSIYNPTYEDMDIIEYQGWDATEEAIEEATRKKVEQH